MSDLTHRYAELLKLCGKVRDQEISPADVARLDEILSSDASALDFYVRYMHIASLLEGRGASQGEAEPASAAGDEQDTDVLLELLRMEAAVDPAPVQLPDHVVAWRQQRMKLARPERLERVVQSPPALWVAAAAVLAVAAALLVLVFVGGDDGGATPEPPMATAPIQPPTNTAAAEPRRVAILSAEHNARWSSPGLAAGDTLYAGQTLTLTEGFAEITTNRGAVAILEAPATIELLDNQNALRLHTGKLIGICETESSKGFVVESRNLRIVDVGTRFGVDARTGVTGVQVEHGEVKVALLYDGHVTGSYQSLTTGTAIEADSSGQIARVAMPREPLMMSISLLKYKPVIDGEPASYLGPLAAASMPWEESLQAKLFLEQYDFSIPADIATDSSPSSAPNVLTRGTSVDVYLFHIDLPGDMSVKTSHTIHFNRPILGVYTTGEGLLESDPKLGVDQVKYPQAIAQNGASLVAARGLDSHHESNAAADEVVFSEDRTSLTLNCVAGRYFDQVRIVVQAALD